MSSIAAFIGQTRRQSATVRGEETESPEIEIDGRVLPEAETGALLADYPAWKAQHDLNINIKEFSAAIQNHLDAKAQERQYDSILSAVSYKDCVANPQYAAEGSALQAWRSQVWAYATAELAKVPSGDRAFPTVEDFLAELPAFTWPDEE